MAVTSLPDLDAFDQDPNRVNVIVDTPHGSRNKFKYDEKKRLFTLRHVLPVGAVFPFDFGFIPSTRAGDGDPLDVLLLMDEPAFAGCLVVARLIGVLEADQVEPDGRSARNDRLIAVPGVSRTHEDIRSLNDLSPRLVDEIEHFFVSYNAARGKQFKTLGRSGPERAEEIAREGVKAYTDKTDE